MELATHLISSSAPLFNWPAHGLNLNYLARDQPANQHWKLDRLFGARELSKVASEQTGQINKMDKMGNSPTMETI